ncbi:unnamed protein product [Thelazia callipaeda]|uniref:Transmembrane protein 50B n=1 Tax=Thelazia callipaeda TaxID=103827 RepID=A0A0N5CZD6_THECL|nr:unnamed protein product [Thelazia callipaeda]
MSGCLDQFSCDINWDLKRNAIASCISSALFFMGWWLMIDTAAIYTPVGQWNNVYIVVTVCGTIAMFMVNAVSNSQIRGESFNESILGTKGSRLWLMLGFVFSFASLVAALWIMFADYVLVTGDHPTWPGVALFFHNFLIFMASLIYKFGRTEELWG